MYTPNIYILLLILQCWITILFNINMRFRSSLSLILVTIFYYYEKSCLLVLLTFFTSYKKSTLYLTSILLFILVYIIWQWHIYNKYRPIIHYLIIFNTAFVALVILEWNWEVTDIRISLCQRAYQPNSYKLWSNGRRDSGSWLFSLNRKLITSCNTS